MSLEFAIIAAEFIRALRGGRSQVALSRRLGFSSNVLHSWERRKRSPTTGRLLELAARTGVDVPGARWLAGTAQPKTPQLLALVHYVTQRLPDFIGVFTDAGALPSLRSEVGRLEAARMVATERPWSQLVLRFLETLDYQMLAAHERGWIAERAGITVAEEEATLRTLVAAGQVTRGKTHYRPQALPALDMRHDRRAVQRQRAFWAGVAAERGPGAADGLCAYNICTVSNEGYQQLKRLQREYLLKARALIAASHPEERVVLLQVNVLPFDI